MRFSLLLAALLCAGLAQAQQMYKCPGADGSAVTFSQFPCGKGAQGISVKPANGPEPVPEIRPPDPMKPIYDKVALDALDRLNIVVRNGGSLMDVCVQAGFVSAALLQAKEEKHYRTFKDAEKKVCGKAGLSRR